MSRSPYSFTAFVAESMGESIADPFLDTPSGGWTKLLLLAGVSTVLGSSLNVGYNIGVVNAPADVIKEFCNGSIYSRWGVVLDTSHINFLWSVIVSIFLVGGAIGSLGGSVFADKVGRKGALIVSTMLGGIAAILFFFSKMSNSVEMLLLARLLVGLSSGLITTVMPMYLTEIAPEHLRGSMGTLCPLGVTAGVLIAQVISLKQILGNESFWPDLLAFYLMPLLLGGWVIPFLPESPKYLYVVRNQPNLALSHLIRIRNKKEEELEAELHELQVEKHDNDLSRNESWNIFKVLTDKTLRLPLVLVCSLQAGQQLSGINAVFYYSVSIFQNVGLSLDNSQLATIGAGVINFLMAVLSIYIMARFNRRTMLVLSLSTTILFLIVLGLSVQFIKSFTWMPYISIVGVLGFVLCYGLALGPIPYFIGSELFEVGPRPSAMAMGSMSNWGGNFLVALLFPLLQTYLKENIFFIFAFFVLGLLVLIWFYFPETRDRNVTEIATLCRSGFNRKIISSPINSTNTTESIM